MNRNSPGNEMSEARLRELISTYGAAHERWPANERSEAQRLLAERLPQDAALATLWRQAQALDLQLRGFEPKLYPVVDLLERIDRSLPPRRHWSALVQAWFARPTLAALPLLAGIALGFSDLGIAEVGLLDGEFMATSAISAEAMADELSQRAFFDSLALMGLNEDGQ